MSQITDSTPGNCDLLEGAGMTGKITFTAQESYQKVGFRTVDNFSLAVFGMTKDEYEWLRKQILHLIERSDSGCLP